MKQLFAVIRSRGPAWENLRALEGQKDWTGHAAFMNALHAEGFVLLGGPFEGTADVLLVVRADDEAEIRRKLAPDPWTRNGLLQVTRVVPWTLRLGSLDAA
jgi:uncharacterized protein YciI